MTHDQINDDAAARLVAAFPTYRKTQMNPAFATQASTYLRDHGEALQAAGFVEAGDILRTVAGTTPPMEIGTNKTPIDGEDDAWLASHGMAHHIESRATDEELASAAYKAARECTSNPCTPGWFLTVAKAVRRAFVAQISTTNRESNLEEAARICESLISTDDDWDHSYWDQALSAVAFRIRANKA